MWFSKLHKSETHWLLRLCEQSGSVRIQCGFSVYTYLQEEEETFKPSQYVNASVALKSIHHGI